MDFSLAKQLKDAGFPQLRSVQDGGRYATDTDTDEMGMYLVAYVPTLEELIAACGKPVWIEGYDVAEFQWLAGRGKGMDTPLGRGSTPTEAVARLWLALNKK